MEVAVNDLVMLTGRSKDDCTLALRAAQGVPDIAYEILASGMPLNQLGNLPVGGDDGGDDPYGEEDEDPSVGGGSMPAGANPFAALAANPNFGLIRQRILQDPNFYNTFMQQLQQSQPQLYAVIQQNPGAFMNLILGGNPNMGVGAPAGGQPSRQPPPPGSIQVSQEEMDAINRLMSLGFSKHKAAEAYFACDKNEEMAANFLFESGGDDEDAVMQRTIAESAA